MTLTAMRDLLSDERIACVAATVQLHEGQTEHFRRDAITGQIIVTVITNQNGVSIDALLKAGDISGRGLWIIPAIGTEVFVCFDMGEFEGDAYIVGYMGRAPDQLDDGITLIIDEKVQIRTLDGTAQKLMTVADGAALKDAIQGAATVPNDGGSAFKANLLTNLSDWPEGTSVLEAE